ncbi:hypothetical protein FSP39_010710 [Pinctada imbricata]|uniref:RING-type domain-containing protein n=1 Tax=Pinctada imbricata TaxID=66713 RepID=A0AA88XF82_PINIB|nr:hypothetical protein FSP39_010710 [Pinctada imbricata]
MDDQDTSQGVGSSNSGWRINVPSNIHTRLGEGLPQVGEAVTGIMPRIIGPSRHHRAILTRLNSQGDRQHAMNDDRNNSVVLDLGDSNSQPFSPNNADMNVHQPDHFQLPPLLSDENQNGIMGEEEHHGHTHDGAPHAQFSLRHLLMNSGVFAVILMIRLLSDHVLGLTGTFLYANMSLQKLVHETSLRDAALRKYILSYLWIVAFLSANVACVFYVFREQALWNLLMFQLPADWRSNFWEFIWVVVVTDLVLKFATVIIKSLFSLFPFGQKRRGKIYMFIEHVMQLYRVAVPIIPWFHFLSDGQGWLFSAFLLILYFVFKLSQVVNKLLEVKSALGRLLSNVSYGSRPSSSDLKSRGEGCPICQDDYKDPIMLACKHIFCESCVSMWFDREKTCPMCRAQISTETPLWKDGSTSVHFQWY